MFSAGPLPACPSLSSLPHLPLNSSQPTNLAGAQKLLSIGGDIEFPVIPGHLGDWSDGVEVSHQTQNVRSDHQISVSKLLN